jgi:hyperosmotically inducible periplasmic protein
MRTREISAQLSLATVHLEQGGNMGGKVNLKIVPGLVLGLGLALAGPVFAQSASQSMKEAGHSAESAVGHTWDATKMAVKDTDITTKVMMALHSDKLTKGQDIHVDTHDRVVTLTGYAPKAVAARAERLARDTTGVVGVNNDLRGRESMRTSMSTVRDTDITANVKRLLDHDKLTNGRDIHVSTHDGMVTLTGHAPHDAAARAVQLAQKTRGVTSVKDDVQASESMSAR